MFKTGVYSKVDGALGAWQHWNHCSATCEGQRKRTRTCVPPQYGGAPCRGNTLDTQACGSTHCPGYIISVIVKLNKDSSQSIYLFRITSQEVL